MRPRHLLLVAAAALLVLVGATFYDAFTASATVAASSVGYESVAVTASMLEPAACTVSVTSVVAGSGTFSATAQNQLVLGSSAKDTVTLQKNDCFVGGGPTSGSKDKVTGVASGGDQCIVNSGATVSNCTVVLNQP